MEAKLKEREATLTDTNKEKDTTIKTLKEQVSVGSTSTCIYVALIVKTNGVACCRSLLFRLSYKFRVKPWRYVIVFACTCTCTLYSEVKNSSIHPSMIPVPDPELRCVSPAAGEEGDK